MHPHPSPMNNKSIMDLVYMEPIGRALYMRISEYLVLRAFIWIRSLVHDMDGAAQVDASMAH